MVCQIWHLGALELELAGGLNNMSWKPDQSTAFGSERAEFEPFPFILGNISIRGEIPKAWAFSFNIERDNIFQNTIDFRLKTRTDYFAFEFGVFTGMTDDFETPDAGILGNMEITWPGVLFISFSGSSTLGASLDSTGNNFRESMGAELGFWLPFMIPVFSVNTKSFTMFSEDGSGYKCDSLTRYKLSADFPFGKTSPVNLRIDGGYQILKRNYDYSYEVSIDTINEIKTATNELSSIFAGFELLFKVSKPFHFFVGAELPFGLKAVEPLTVSDDVFGLYKAWGGVRFIFY